MELLEILKSLKDGVDFEAGRLISDGILDSMDILRLIQEIEKNYDIKVKIEYLQPDNFESIDAIQSMIDSLKAEKL